MLDIDGIWSTDKKMKIATGLTIVEASEVYNDFSDILSGMRTSVNNTKNAGRPSKLTQKEIFLMTMIFLRQYITFDFLGMVFEIDTSNVKRWINESIDALETVLVKKTMPM